MESTEKTDEADELALIEEGIAESERDIAEATDLLAGTETEKSHTPQTYNNRYAALSDKEENEDNDNESTGVENDGKITEVQSRSSSRWDFHFHSYVLTIYVRIY